MKLLGIVAGLALEALTPAVAVAGESPFFQVRNLGLALHPFFPIRVSGELAAFVASETRQGIDLNGDGDLLDDVVHVFDARMGVTTNLRLATGGSPRVAGELVAFGVNEAAQSGHDLDGDGDTDDDVVHLYDATTGTTSNLRLAPTDPNGEHDDVPTGRDDLVAMIANDAFVHVFDTRSNTLRDLGLASRLYSADLAVGDDLVGFQANEALTGRDLNGDRDALDRVVHVFDARADSVVNLGLAGGGANDDVVVSGRLVAFRVSETGEGRDLNGDGSLGDDVIHVVVRTLFLPCERGMVNSASGTVADVLRVNGAPESITLSIGSPLTVSLDVAPGGPGSGRFGVWVWTGVASSPLPLLARGSVLGCTVRATPFHPGAPTPQPYRCLRGGLPDVFCRNARDMASPTRAPWMATRTQGFTRAIGLVLQGVLEDAGSGNASGYSVTNAVSIRVE